MSGFNELPSKVSAAVNRRRSAYCSNVRFAFATKRRSISVMPAAYSRKSQTQPSSHFPPLSKLRLWGLNRDRKTVGYSRCALLPSADSDAIRTVQTLTL
jgi:hypothetical protein